MKKLLLTAMLATTVLGLSAQNLEKIKNNVKAKKYTEAKDQIETFLANEKNAKNLEAWYTKAKIYAEISLFLSAISTLLKIIPLFSGAGKSAILTSLPL